MSLSGRRDEGSLAVMSTQACTSHPLLRCLFVLKNGVWHSAKKSRARVMEAFGKRQSSGMDENTNQLSQRREDGGDVISSEQAQFRRSPLPVGHGQWRQCGLLIAHGMFPTEGYGPRRKVGECFGIVEG